jgi:serine/threonine protein kinase
VLQQIDRYEIKRELGRGGMATVYLAYDPRFQREVAIKMLPRQFTHEPRFLERFEQEARTIAALEDPAIVPVHDFGEFDDAPYLVMRYMAGGTLRERMDGKPLSLAEIDQILGRLAPALYEAHRRGIIHRDLKPDNVLFDSAGRPYLADFGIARMAEATHTMTVVGTPAYMSPEQAQGKQKLDLRSDIYALGVMLFEMLTGQQPYVAETPTGQMLMHILEPVPDVLAANPELPVQAQVVIDKGMAKDREARYQTAVEVAETVRQLLTAPQATIEPPVPMAQPTVLEVDTPVVALEQEEEAIQVETDDVTMLDTPPEELAVAAIADSVVEEKIPDPAPAPRSLEGQRPGIRGQLPAWAWWTGAIAVVLLLVFGIRTIFGGGGEATPDAAGENSETISAVVPTTTTTLSPTATLDPKVLPPDPALGSVWQRPQDKMQMVYVPPGSFSMGSEEGDSDEEPVHSVALDGFWIDETEVTNAHYADCVDAGECTASRYEDDSTYNGDGSPVVGVSWNDADTYCRWVGGQLPA